MYHSGPVPWAEEVPVYTASVGYFHRWTGIPLVILGRSLSFSFFVLLILGAYRLGKAWFPERSKSAGAIFAAVFASLPGFQIYGISFMPDLGMTVFCLWAWVFAIRGQTARSALTIGVATLFKYYAVFTALGLGLSMLILRPRGWKSAIKNGCLYAGAVLPAVLYLYYVISSGVPNSVTEYLALSKSGHFSSLSSLFNSHFLLRMITWNIVKNPTPIAGILALIGAAL